MADSSYCTAAEVKAALPDGSWGSAYDALLDALVMRASRALDRFTGRNPGAYRAETDATRYFDGSGTRELWIEELAAAPTAVSVAETGDISGYTAWVATDYLLWPYNAVEQGEPYRRLDIDHWGGTKSLWYAFPKAVQVVGKFGYSESVPEDIVQAAIIQSVRWFKRGQHGFQDVGAITELGQLQYVQQLDPDVTLLVEHLRR